MSRYRTIVADPPWRMRVGGPRTGPWNEGKPGTLPYLSMSLADIAGLPVSELAQDQAHLYLWTTNTFLRDAYSIAEGWGFRPSQLLVWAKAPRGKGPGWAFANTTEFVLFCWCGDAPTFNEKMDTTWWSWPRGPHSTKPDAFLDVVEQVSPGPYLEMFARRARFGWDYWGDESLGTAEIKETA